jgi:hypothetical protein
VKFVIESKSRKDSAILAFEIVAGKLICLGDTADPASIHVPAFDPELDIFYRTPEKLSPEELNTEVAIHFPEHLLGRTGRRVIASSLRGAVLLQPQQAGITAISPISALAEVIGKIGDVNSAILEAANGGLLFVHRSGDELSAHFSMHSLWEFAALRKEEREAVFSELVAMEVLVSGSDMDHLPKFKSGDVPLFRKIAAIDFLPLCEFTEDSLKFVELNPALYTAAIGAASIIATIAKESATQ